MRAGGFMAPGVAPAENGRKNFSDNGTVRGDIEPVERPEMRSATVIRILPQESQPGDAAVGGFADRILAIQLEYALGRGGPLFRQP